MVSGVGLWGLWLEVCHVASLIDGVQRVIAALLFVTELLWSCEQDRVQKLDNNPLP